jgi:hypothetical protein
VVIVERDHEVLAGVENSPELLFHEAKKRRERRWWVGGIACLVLLVLFGLGLGLSRGQSPTSSTGAPHRTPRAVPLVASAARLSFRPVLCYAPAYAPAAGQIAPSGPLPVCGPKYALTVTNLGVDPNTSSPGGFSTNHVGPDPQFAAYPSSTKQTDNTTGESLISGTPSANDLRYVVGPAALNQTSIQSARAEPLNGGWVIRLRMTNDASVRLDLLTYHTFHSVIGFDLNGRIIAASITLGGQPHWSSFDGQIQITGSFTENQAKALAAEL